MYVVWDCVVSTYDRIIHPSVVRGPSRADLGRVVASFLPSVCAISGWQHVRDTSRLLHQRKQEEEELGEEIDEGEKDIAVRRTTNTFCQSPIFALTLKTKIFRKNTIKGGAFAT